MKRFWTATLSGLVFLAATQLCLIKLADANPILDRIKVSPPVNPIISILSPAENNTVHPSSNLTIGFNATIKSEIASVYLTWVQYKTSWQSYNITVWQRDDYPEVYTPTISEYAHTLRLTGIPEGNQTVTIIVYGRGYYIINNRYYYFSTVSCCGVDFIVDTVSPEVSVLKLDNETFVELEVPLNFTVNELVSKVSYVLDGQENVSVAGNTTLTSLTFGAHNVTVYAWDAAGNVGSSETAYFTITEPEQEPFPTTLVATASAGASATIIGIAFIVYFKKRRH